ncbi:HNH endonuclease [Chryseobacterium scophthalmum]|uniref:HNH endonuclease n=1 Tax=Chryseobacterium scophthalmum TaxID=59733 RepID=UPI00398AE642
MLIINPKKEAIDFHKEKVIKLFEETIKKEYILRKKIQKKLPTEFLVFLEKYKEELISAKPYRLLEIHQEFEKKRISTYQLKLIKSFFIQTGYKNFPNKEFLNLLGIDTCVYCNRNYTLDFDKLNNARAELDHWFPKETYFILALSFYNLIPSCHSCNHIKHNNAPDGGWDNALQNINHPYLEDTTSTFSFSYFYSSINQPKTIIKSNNEKSKKSIEFNKVDKIYETQSDRELKDLLELRYKYSQNYLDILLNKTFIKEFSMSKKEAHRLVFGIEQDEQDYHKRPFSKFKKDIIDELLRSK